MNRGTNVTASEVLEVFRHWARVMGKKSVFLDPKRDKTIRQALHMGATIEQCKLAIDGCRASRWHMGENDRRTVYNDLSLILRDAEHIERFIESAEAALAREAKRKANAQQFEGEKRPMPHWVREQARHLRLLKPGPSTPQSSIDFGDVRQAS